MKPAAFEYHRPGTVAEALAVLAEVGHDGKVLAGGQSLVPLLNMRLAAPAHLVDVNWLAELDQDQPWPTGADGPRGRTSGNNRVVLPDGWLKDPYDCAGVSEDAELDTSGG